MTEHLAATLDLRLAWQRVKWDITNSRAFVRNPYEIDLVEADLDGWLSNLTQEIENGFNPSAATIAEVPKGGGAVRPGALLNLEDKVVYAACVGTALPAIYSTLEWSQGEVDFSYQISKEHHRPEWMKSAFPAWASFRERSLQKIQQGATHVVVTDITGFYENIDIGTLISDLRQIGIDIEVVNLLSACLNRWTLGHGRGLPQGNSSSDILAKLYLNSIDLLIKEHDFIHLRYVDDMRIFCAGEVEAKSGLLTLTQLLRRRGLNLQSAKTKILSSGEASEKIEAVIPVLQGVQEEFIRTVVQQAGYEGPYITIAEADRLAAERQEGASTEVLRDVFRKYFLEGSEPFDGTLFRFIINRLRNKRDNYCQDYCLSLLTDHPEETKYVLRYLEAIENFEETMNGLQTFLNSGHAIYDYQLYQIFEWLASLNQHPTEALKAVARTCAFDNSKPAYLRSVCRRLLGQHPTIADLERIEASYATTTVPLERAQVLCDLRGLEPGRRNSFLARARRDHPLCSHAVQMVRENKL